MKWYDHVYSKERKNGYYLKLTGTTFIYEYEIIPVAVEWIHAEVHTSHSFEIEDVIITKDTHEKIKGLPQDNIKSSFFHTYQTAKEAGDKLLKETISKIETLKKLTENSLMKNSGDHFL